LLSDKLTVAAKLMMLPAKTSKIKVWVLGAVNSPGIRVPAHHG
jgi:hypothetical protein